MPEHPKSLFCAARQPPGITPKIDNRHEPVHDLKELKQLNQYVRRIPAGLPPEARRLSLRRSAAPELGLAA